ncbi:MAG: hypothetical protein ACD_5C00151G0003 [uncultured bacterium]|nr:MAG: hypothetical protein ACD_5C00151G0003 [uncultured bacterium]
MEKRKNGQEITQADKAMMAGLLEHGVNKSWLDDGVWSHMGPELEETMRSELGWEGTEFNVEKINDLMALMATGGDMEFAAVNNKVGKAMDFARKQLGMSTEQFYDKLENADFTAGETAAMEGHFGAGSDIIKTIQDKSKVAQYIKTQDENQAQIQYITNLRDDMAAGSHSENGGHAVKMTSRSGKQRNVFVGAETAQDNVLGEVNKGGPSDNAGKQTHSVANLDERSNYVTRMRSNAYRIHRGRINNHLAHGKTNARYINQVSGLAATESAEEYFDEKDGSFLITGTKANGADSGRHSWAQGFSDKNINLKARYEKVKTACAGGKKMKMINKEGKEVMVGEQDALHQQTTNDWFNDIFLDQLIINPQDALMTIAKNSHVDPQEAYLNGTMNISVMVGGKKVHVTDVNKLIGYYNNGCFSADGKKPSRHLPSYKKVEPKAQTKARQEAGGTQG